MIEWCDSYRINGDWPHVVIVFSFQTSYFHFLPFFSILRNFPVSICAAHCTIPLCSPPSSFPPNFCPPNFWPLNSWPPPYFSRPFQPFCWAADRIHRTLATVVCLWEIKNWLLKNPDLWYKCSSEFVDKNIFSRMWARISPCLQNFTSGENPLVSGQKLRKTLIKQNRL